jgi:hypothetical protein
MNWCPTSVPSCTQQVIKLNVDIFIYCLFNISVSSSNYIVSNDWMINRKGYGMKHLWPNLRNCCGIFLEGLRKTTRNHSDDIRSPGQDLDT